MHPSVSVVVPNFRHADYLPKRLESILGQTFSDFELIILDDASPDNSREVIARYLGDPRASFHPSEINSGNPFRQWAKGLALASGDYVWIAESDDFAEPVFLESMMSLARTHPTAGLIYCQSDVVEGESGGHRTMLDHYQVFGNPDRWRQDYFNKGRDEIARFLALRNIIPNASACLFRRDIFASIGGPAEGYKLCGDWVTYAGILAVSDIAFCAATLNHYRLHPQTARRTAEHSLTEPLETYMAQAAIARLVHLEKPVRAFAAALAFQRMHYLIIEQQLTCIPNWLQISAAATAFDPEFEGRLGNPSSGMPRTAAFYLSKDGKGFTEDLSQRRLLPPGEPWTVWSGPCRGVPRLDPSASEGYGKLIYAIFRDSSGRELWRSDAASGFEGTTLAGTAARVADAGGLAFYAWGNDPIILFPGFRAPADSDYFIECEIIAGDPTKCREHS